ncbi:MAG: ion transporter [Bacteroidales bacterium]|nr:ion transporter [Bacteroidales bacterium]MBQ1709170.1 ion transporter [Bacteroidales bacterium]MBQ4012900.1 ion transporter [Bacteroidales bacterium]
MDNWRKRIFEIIQRAEGDSRISRIYDIVMMVLIVASIIPLMFLTYHPAFRIIELVTVIVFIIDYLLRWITADYKLGRGALSFLIYPFTFMAIIDLLSIIPVFTVMSNSFKLLRLTRLFRIARLLKFIRYTDKLDILVDVLKREKKVLVSVLVIAAFYVFITALIMFNVEPQVNPDTGQATFASFFDALYWATVTLTTVGYGDVCPVTSIGRFVSMLSSLFGVAIIALPSGVITASYLDELRNKQEEKEKGEAAQN